MCNFDGTSLYLDFGCGYMILCVLKICQLYTKIRVILWNVNDNLKNNGQGEVTSSKKLDQAGLAT